MKIKDMMIINQQSLERVEHLKPIFANYDNGKEFMELYQSGIPFVQVYFYDHTHNGESVEKNFNMDLVKKDELIHRVKVYNSSLKKVQDEIVTMTKLSDYDKKIYYQYQRVGYNLGISYFDIFVREREEKVKQKSFLF